jgi:hypothetical protein
LIGSEVLLFPDTGPDFNRVLRTAVLYSEKVQVITILQPPEFVERVTTEWASLGRSDLVSAQRTVNYFRFIRDAASDLRLLTREGLVRSVVHDVSATWDDVYRSRSLAQQQLFRDVSWLTSPERPTSALVETALRAFKPDMACLSDLDMISFCRSVLEGHQPECDLYQSVGVERIAKLFFLRYLIQLAVISEERGIAALSWSRDFQKALWAVRKLFTQAPPDFRPTNTRDYIAAKLGQAVLERRLPLAHDLPLEELLEVRRRRGGEIESLRVALHQLATHVDPTQSPEEIERSVGDLIASTVDPAVDELKRSLAAARLDALKKIGRSSASLAAATFSASLMLAAGAPLNLAAALAALGGVLGTVAETAVDRLRLMKASQWALLVRLPRITKKGGAPRRH